MILLGAIATGLGSALVAYPLLAGLAGLAGALWRRRGRAQWRGLLAAQQQTEETAQAVRRVGSLLTYLPAACLAVAAAALAHPLVTPVLMAEAVAYGLFGRWRERQGRTVAAAEEAATLVRLFRGVFIVERSVAAGLEKGAAALRRGEVRQAAAEAARRYRMGLSLASATAPLRRAEQSHVRQLALVIDRIESADHAAVTAALDGLDRQLARQRRLRGKARASFALIGGTLRALEGANAAVLLWVVANPVWRDFFLATPRRSLALALLSGLAAGSAVLFDMEIMLQESRAL